MDRWISLFVVCGVLAGPALGHHLGYNYSPERAKERAKVALRQEPREYRAYPEYATYTQEGEVRSEELLAWFKNQTKKQEVKKQEPKKPEEYSVSKSREIASWTQVAKGGEDKAEVPAPWYEQEYHYNTPNHKQNSKYKEPVSWVQFAIPKFPEKPGKIEYPTFEKLEQFEKQSLPASSYFTKEPVSWPSTQAKNSEPQKKKPETHWVWNHKLSKLEKVEKKQEQPKSKIESRQGATNENSHPKKETSKQPIIREHEKVQVFTHEVEVPYEVRVEKEVRVPVHVPEERPVPYTVFKHIPVVVERKVPVPVKVKVPYPVPVYKEVKVPVKLKEERLAPYDVDKHVPVYLERPVHFVLEKKVPFPVKEIHESFKPFPTKEQQKPAEVTEAAPAKPAENKEPEKKEEVQYEYVWYKKPETQEAAEDSKAEEQPSWESVQEGAGEAEARPEGYGNYYKTTEKVQEEEEEGKEEQQEEKEEVKKQQVEVQRLQPKKSKAPPKEVYWYHH